MSLNSSAPRAEGQLIWCPSDPSLGIGVVTRLARSQIHVRFLRQQEDRAYTTRTAESIIVRYQIGEGERVRYKSQENRVVRVVDQEGPLTVYQLEDGTEVTENELVPEVRDIGAKARLASLSLVHPEVVRARMQGLSLSRLWPRPGVAGIFGTRALWLPHQIDVATRAIARDRVRMLLADEVGLGKTVEAILIYAGLRYEGRANRVLILTPEVLTIQWLGEIFRKAHELMILLDPDRIDDARQDFPDLTPFEAHQRVVASLDLVAGDAQLSQEAMNANWDLVIVDEAHHLRWSKKGGGNPKYRLIEGLASKTQHLLLLTATPMALDPTEYHALLRLLDPARFDDPSSFESIRDRVGAIREVGRALNKAINKNQKLAAQWHDMAAEVLADDPDDVAKLQELQALKPDDPERLDLSAQLMDALRERHGLADYVVRNRRGPVGGLPERKPQIFMLQPSELQEHLIDVGESVMFELADTIADEAQRYATLGRLLRALWATPRALVDILRPLSASLAEELAPHVADVVSAPIDSEGLPTGDQRLRWLVSLLRRDRHEKVLVFVETDIAVRALKDALETVLGGDTAVFHRGLSPRDQDRQVSWFRDPAGPQVMLCTEAGGEGRNFQFCNRVVLYDMPWRPATVEQRIGRIDRVGQKRDVHVLVPCFKGGFEAAVLKVMQESIGVLDQTVGGIDHALEYVSDRLGELILTGAGAEAWKSLYQETLGLVTETRDRIESSVDPILDHASFDPDRVEAVLRKVPADLEERTEAFVRGYANHSKLDVHTKAGPVVGVEGAPGAAGRSDWDTAYSATFSRTYGIDHEDVEFLSFGHPLVENAIEWAETAHEASAALAIARGYDQDGAVFIWQFSLDLPSDVPEAAAYFENELFTVALDESGKRQPQFESLLEQKRPLDRMDAAPLRAAVQRWGKLVEQSFTAAEPVVKQATSEAAAQARQRLKARTAQRRRYLDRQLKRRLAEPGLNAAAKAAAKAEHGENVAELDREDERLRRAIEHARPRLLSAVAVRLIKSRQVSG